jgi:ketosteroid isomerase-like protein
MRTLLVLSLSAVLLASCAKPVPPIDIAKVRTEVEALAAKSAADMNAGTMDTTLSQYAADPISLPNNGPMLKGKAAIKEYFGKMATMGMTFSDVKLITVDVSAGGQYVYEVGTYVMTINIPNMGAMTDHGKYLTVYERAADGKLKIKVETWNTDVMPPMPEPEAAQKKKK